MSVLKKKIYLIISVLIGIFVAITLIGLCCWYVLVVPALAEARCRLNLSEIRRGMDEDNFLLIDNIRYFKDELTLSNTFDKNRLICPVCKKPYVYSPVSPSGKRIANVRYEEKEYDYFVMWCPEPCHKGRRAFLDASLGVYLYHDSEVSWYYQKLLTETKEDDELKRENEYRLSQNMNPLKE